MTWIDYIYIKKRLNLTLHEIQALHSLAKRSKGGGGGGGGPGAKSQSGAEVIRSKGCFSLSGREDWLWLATWYTRWQFTYQYCMFHPYRVCYSHSSQSVSLTRALKKPTGCNYKKIWDPLGRDGKGVMRSRRQYVLEVLNLGKIHVIWFTMS